MSLENLDIALRGLPVVRIAATDTVGSLDVVLDGMPWLGMGGTPETSARVIPSLVAAPLILHTNIVSTNQPNLDPTTVLLANLYISADSTVDTLTLIDTRRRGGGVDPNNSLRQATLSGAQKTEAENMWDISSWDGKPSLINGKILVKVPATKLIENGGTYTREQIDEIIQRNLPVGIYPIVQYI